MVSLHPDLALILLFNLPQSAPAGDQYFCREVPLNNPNQPPRQVHKRAKAGPGRHDTKGGGRGLHLDLALILLFNLPQGAPARDQYFCHEVPLNNPNSLAADQKNDVHHDTKQGSEWGFPYMHRQL